MNVGLFIYLFIFQEIISLQLFTKLFETSSRFHEK